MRVYIYACNVVENSCYCTIRTIKLYNTVLILCDTLSLDSLVVEGF